MVSCQEGPTRHAYAWQIGPFWQDTLDLYFHLCFLFVPWEEWLFFCSCGVVVGVVTGVEDVDDDVDVGDGDGVLMVSDLRFSLCGLGGGGGTAAPALLLAPLATEEPASRSFLAGGGANCCATCWAMTWGLMRGLLERNRWNSSEYINFLFVSS